mmetsp:Transcript_22260/g.23213  ORF Transcript_22260/g.23213 Transcript_22260/m.23213 type:complete len:540 (+) Transcript_22260:3-1622(+)
MSAFANKLILIYINVNTAITYTLPLPLFPTLAYNKGVNESLVGIIFAIYSITNILVIPNTNILVNYFGRKGFLILLHIAKIISSFLYIYLEFVESRTFFITMAFIARSLQGFSVELINVIVFSLATLLSSSPKENSQNLSLVEAATSIGYIIGPLIAFIFSRYGYAASFIVSIIIDIVGVLIIKFHYKEDLEERESEEEISPSKMHSQKFSTENIKNLRSSISIIFGRHIPQIDTKYFSKGNSLSEDEEEDALKKNSLDESNKEADETDDEFEVMSLPIQKKRKLYYKYEFVYKEPIEDGEDEEEDAINSVQFLRITFQSLILPTFLSVIADYIAQTFFLPVFTIEMKKKYQVTEESASLYLSIGYFFYLISLRLMPMCIKLLPIKYLLCLGLLFNSVSCLFLNPIHLLNQSVVYSIIGICVLNTFAGFISITSLIDFNNSLRIQGYSSDFASTTASAIYVFGLNIAELFGPTLGGALTHNYGYEFTCVLVGLINLLLSIIYFSTKIKSMYYSLTQRFKKLSKIPKLREKLSEIMELSH